MKTKTIADRILTLWDAGTLSQQEIADYLGLTKGKVNGIIFRSGKSRKSKYSPAYRWNVVDFSIMSGLERASEFFGLARATILGWRKALSGE